jgi:SHAQKYF class myb-like DNA-binding protein
MAYDMMNSSSAVVSTMRPTDYDLTNANGAASNYYKSAFSFPGGRATHTSLSIQEQAELEYELRYRGNMIVDQQRKIQQLEDELRQARDQVDMMNSQLSTYEQDRVKEKKKPQSRYWTPEEHQRFLEALQKYGHKDVKSISMHVSTRNATQVRTHAQKYFLRLVCEWLS